MGRYLSKPREEAKKHYFFIVSVSSSCSEFSLNDSLPLKSQMNPFLLMLILAMVFFTATYSILEQSCYLATVCYLYMLTTRPGEEDAGVKTVGPLCCPLKQERTLGSVPRINRENKNTKLSKSRPQVVKRLTQDD